MSDNDDFIARLEDYLDGFDGVTPLPDRVRDAIRAELPSARQVPPRTGPMRVFNMLSSASAGARVGLAAAVVVAIAVLGAAALNNGQRGGVVGDAPTPAPTATPAASLEPTPSATSAPSVALQPPPLNLASLAPCDVSANIGHGCLEAGTYRLSGAPGVWPATVSMDVPVGWFEWSGGTGWDAVLVDKGRGASGWGAMFYTVGDVARDPCASQKGWIPAEQVDTPKKLAAAMAAWPRFTATTPKPITMDGHGGLRFKLTSAVPSSCADLASVGHTTSGGLVDAYPMVSPYHQTSTVEIVDTGNGLLVIRATDFPQPSAFEQQNGTSPDPTFHSGDLADLHAILDSIRITRAPSS